MFLKQKDFTMQTGNRKNRLALFLMVGLIVLAGIGPGARDASAQALEGCPLPEGLAALPDPAVTAQDVEDGSATLEQFAEAAVSQFKRGGSEVATPQQLAYSGCRLRLEGGPWRSGSTYIVTLTPDGRVYLHARNMSLSARRLRSPIYAGILQALGTPGRILLGTASEDPATAASAQEALVEFLRDEPGPAAFDLTAPTDRRPGLPGVSGQAAVYVSVNSQNPLILLTGFDLNEQHLVSLDDENIDYGDPAITASEVVDRATLRQFVGEALRFIARTVAGAPTTAESRVAFQKARLALRDPDGPWRDGPVYIHMVDGASNLILFHGGFPDRLELMRGGINRDIGTGELVFDQLVDAARSGPDGGFWLYHFDSPADETDSAQVPKVGYARQFVRTTTTADGSEIHTNLIIASGFYLNADGVFVQRVLESLEDEQTSETSIMFGMTEPEDGDVVSGDAVDVSVAGAPTDAVHFAYRLAGMPDEPFTYLGAATNREAVASFTWDTLDMPDDDYELATLYTEDDGYNVVYDTIEVSIDNIGDGGGGCVAVPVLPGGSGPLDPTLPALVGLVMAYLMLQRRHRMRQAVLA